MQNDPLRRRRRGGIFEPRRRKNSALRRGVALAAPASRTPSSLRLLLGCPPRWRYAAAAICDPLTMITAIASITRSDQHGRVDSPTMHWYYVHAIDLEDELIKPGGCRVSGRRRRAGDEVSRCAIAGVPRFPAGDGMGYLIFDVPQSGDGTTCGVAGVPAVRPEDERRDRRSSRLICSRRHRATTAPATGRLSGHQRRTGDLRLFQRPDARWTPCPRRSDGDIGGRFDS